MIRHQRESIENGSAFLGTGNMSRRAEPDTQRAEQLLAVNRIDRAHRNYKQLKLNSITMPVKHRSQTNNELLAEKGRQRLKQRQESERQKQIEWV